MRPPPHRTWAASEERADALRRAARRSKVKVLRLTANQRRFAAATEAAPKRG